MTANIEANQDLPPLPRSTIFGSHLWGIHLQNRVSTADINIATSSWHRPQQLQRACQQLWGTADWEQAIFSDNESYFVWGMAMVRLECIVRNLSVMPGLYKQNLLLQWRQLHGIRMDIIPPSYPAGYCTQKPQWKAMLKFDHVPAEQHQVSYGTDLSLFPLPSRTL